MAKTFNSSYFTLTTSEADVMVMSGKSLSLLIQCANITASTVTVELWITDASNNHVACLVPSQSIAAYGGTSDDGKHVIPDGYKIRGLASAGTSVMVEVNVMAGM
jgi:hypothetical protein